MGITNFKIDQAATFLGVAFLACQPKTAFQSATQDTTKDGVPKWEVQVVGTVRDQFGKIGNEVLKIGVASLKDPGQGVMPYTPVQLVGFEVGVMEKTKRNPSTGEEKIIGTTVWYRAEEIRPTTATGKQAA
ncbi:hypothetical protein GT755_38355 [Herbidospora sp. NEAU-GS84]|uniref:Uncharacterized protein n=1 Tax=Herbidospora solisilvae TaxID=2696284 RepID=A0A7C9NN68_9ACTN|nr:hypothetical protein [Herbidospora solisilvae]NAS27518.1 hypothetical protein [Herbidospora solisilvae]